MPKLTLANARLRAAELGCSLRKTQAGEFRVCLIGYPEDFACYESDLQAALDTAGAQAIWRKKYGKSEVPGEPTGYIILTPLSCGKCWEVDVFVRKVFPTYAQAAHFLKLYAPSGKSFKICAVSETSKSASLEDMEQEARREDAKGE